MDHHFLVMKVKTFSPTFRLCAQQLATFSQDLDTIPVIMAAEALFPDVSSSQAENLD